MINCPFREAVPIHMVQTLTSKPVCAYLHWGRSFGGTPVEYCQGACTGPKHTHKYSGWPDGAVS